MPTDKPYSVSAKLTQHKKPTRRTPGDNTLVGHSAVVLVVDGEASHDNLNVLASTDQDGQDISATPEGMAIWLALGSYLQERVQNPKLALLFQAILGLAYRLIQEPAAVEMVTQMHEALQDGLTVEQAEELLVATRKTSTAGTN